jgi:Cof subfamily protein (haloacid dehalogenase superfamily)
MPYSEIKLVAIDLDGTLLNDKRQIPGETIEAIQMVQRQGVIVTLASGRSFCSVLSYARQLNIEVPLITHCGAYVTDVKEETIVIKKRMDFSKAKKIISLFEEKDYYIKVYCNNMFFVQEATPKTVEFSVNFDIPYTVVGRKQLKTLKETPFRIVLQDEPERIQYAKEQLSQWKDVVTVFQDSPRGLEIVDAKVSKGLALRALCQKFDIPTSKVLAIGNEGNDISMLRVAGLGIAMGNASAELKCHADVITKSNLERGVEYALRKYVLKENL